MKKTSDHGDVVCLIVMVRIPGTFICRCLFGWRWFHTRTFGAVKGEFTQYPFFLRFCFLKKYAFFHPHFYKSISVPSRLLYIDKNFVQKFCV